MPLRGHGAAQSLIVPRVIRNLLILHTWFMTFINSELPMTALG